MVGQNYYEIGSFDPSTALDDTLWMLNFEQEFSLQLKGLCSPLELSPDGRHAVAAAPGYSGELKVVDLETTETRSLSGDRHSIHSIVILPDGRAAFTKSSDGLRLWNLNWARVRYTRVLLFPYQ